MPEHISLLRQIQVENQKIQMPLLDDHQLQDMMRRLIMRKSIIVQ